MQINQYTDLMLGQENSRKVEITSELIAKMQCERTRTSIGPQALLKPYSEKPKGLNHGMVTHWLGGRVKTAKLEHLDFVLKAWERLKTIETVQVTGTLLDELREAQRRSGINAEMMMRWSDAGEMDLSVSKIKHCLSGKAKTMRADHVAFMKRVWRSEA